jgi:hypothetical protein
VTILSRPRWAGTPLLGGDTPPTVLPITSRSVSFANIEKMPPEAKDVPSYRQRFRLRGPMAMRGGNEAACFAKEGLASSGTGSERVKGRSRSRRILSASREPRSWAQQTGGASSEAAERDPCPRYPARSRCRKQRTRWSFTIPTACMNA